ncbi:MAG: hypothetical protein NC417_04620 [Candidatus Gastranaerophilales bacterium]|nr:hypothetical protein [Candidatus Gastranaerophilales bacterium]
MSLLWRNDRPTKKENKMPSPKHSTGRSDHALTRKLWEKFTTSIKGISPSAFLDLFLSGKVRASMTVEAAIVLPIFLFFFINMGCAIEMIRLHGNLELALRETGNKLSVYGYVLERDDAAEKDGSGLGQEVLDIAFSYTYVKGQIINYAGKEYLNQSPLIYGTDGLQFVESEIFTGEDQFELVLTYAVSPWMQMPGVRPFRMANKYYGHIWNGYELGNMPRDNSVTKDYVYLARNGTVYHESPNCTHLALTIREVSMSRVPYERNESGGKYTCCEKCGRGVSPETVYIGVQGDRYHYDRDCPGLRRSIYTLEREEAQARYRPCSRCG